MIFTLLQVVCLVTLMGVGAKASTPIVLNKADTQEIQKNKAIEKQDYNFQFDMTSYVTDHDTITAETDYLSSWEKGTGTYSNNNFQIKLSRYYYRYLRKNGNNYYIDSDWVTGNITPRMTVLEITPNKTIDTINLKWYDSMNVNIYYPVNVQTYSAIWHLTEKVYVTRGNYESLLNIPNSFNAIDTVKSTINSQEFQLSASKQELAYDWQLYSQNQDIHTEQHEFNLTNFMGGKVKTYIVIQQDIQFETLNSYESFVVSNWANNNTVNQDLMRASAYIMTGQLILNDAEITTEVIDLPGLMWEILSMPFSFMSTAFNLTLFPGTAYQVNISQLLLTIIGILIFIFIIKIIAGRK